MTIPAAVRQARAEIYVRRFASGAEILARHAEWPEQMQLGSANTIGKAMQQCRACRAKRAAVLAGLSDEATRDAFDLAYWPLPVSRMLNADGIPSGASRVRIAVELAARG